uniref:Reverse transcriptase n=1 Tax=Phytophthora ramorum TaxID=164328 RepID=H3H8H0_PHYRM
APVAIYLADVRRIECLEKATVVLELVTAAGPVHMRDVECLVLDSDVEELLLGNDAMKSLGIDVERMIEQLAGASLLEEKDEFPVGDELIPANSGEDGVLDQLVDEALANGMPGEHVDRLRSLVHEHGDVFRERLGDDPPALVELLKVTLTDDAVSFCCKPRKYAPLQSAFLREYTAELEKRGFIRKNNAAKWACAAVPVRKPGSQTEFRITIDYRPVNKVTVPIAGAMPNLAVVSSSVRGARCFAKFDMIKGFWQLPLDVDSQELMSFMTEDTVYTPTRPQGAVDSAIHFQMQMQDAMAPMLQRNALVWVDDVIIFAPTVEEFLQALKEFFIILRDRRLKLSAAKSSLFQLEVLWCGKLISGSGVRHDPERVDALSALPVPSTVAELQYFVCASNWLHDSLPDYARVVAPLQERLGMERKRIGRRNRNALNVAVTLTEAEITSYNEVKTLIKASVPLVFPSPTSELVVMTDASLTGWSIVVTEVQAWDDSLPVDKQQHRMILCKGGTFKDSQLNWAIVEKEAFPIVKACTDLEYLLQRERGFKLFCDHANLIYIFAPHVELKKHRYGCPEMMMSDQGSHFRNETLKILCGRLKIEQHFSPVYTPWPFLLPVIQANLNQTPDTVTPSLRSICGLTREAKGTTTNFDVGDYVLWSRVDERLAHNKLLTQWVGPFAVSEARPHYFMIRHLLTGSTYEVHGSRLRFYADSSLDVTEEILEFVSNQGMLLGVDGFSDHRYNADASRWELLVKWTGLKDIETSWEPLKSLKVEVPIKVRDYATTVEDEAFAEAVEQA